MGLLHILTALFRLMQILARQAESETVTKQHGVLAKPKTGYQYSKHTGCDCCRGRCRGWGCCTS